MPDLRHRLRRFPGPARLRSLVLAAVGLLAALMLMPLADGPALAQTSSWISLFDGTPTTPQPYNPSTWDILVHSRDRETWKQLEPMAAHHGADCSGPPNTHQVSGYDQAVFLCNGHIMTSINASGYGAIYLTPDRLVDFGSGETVVRFDMSTFRSSRRDWVDLWLSPWDDQIPLPLENWLPDLTGGPRRSIHIRMDDSEGNSFFRGLVARDFGGDDVTTNSFLSYESFLTPSASRRDTFELRISRTTLKFGMPTYNKWWIDTRFADLGWSQGVLQLGHHSYNPTKCDGSCSPNTWHWDNVSISNAVPFVMLKPDQPWVDSTSRRWVTYQGGAPANSYLRFAGIGSGLQVSFNGGQSWQNAAMHAVEQAPEDHFKPYWMPVPAGTSRVDFRGSAWYGGDWMVRDPAIWSQTLPPQPSNCTTRPRTTLQTRALGGGRLEVTVQAGRPGTAPHNTVRQLQIVRATNAQVQVQGQTIGAGGGTVTPTTASSGLTFTVVRQSAGAPVTVPLVVTDDCGPWSTFVGGGPGSF
jgi:hypothetical protein